MDKNEIQLESVDSSQIHAIGHDADTNTLAVQFKKKNGPGSVYHYSNVTKEMYDRFKSSPSLGKHFGEHFKSDAVKHPYTKVS